MSEAESQTVMHFPLPNRKQDLWMSVNGKPVMIMLGSGGVPVLLYQCEAAPLQTKPRELRVVGVGENVPGDRGLELVGAAPNSQGGLFYVWIGPPQMDAVYEE